jgi:hypothetical protein
VGCIPLTDPVIEEVYVLTASTRAAGQDFIPLHIFPIAFKNDKSKETLEKYLENQPDYKPLAQKLEKFYYYFEVKKQLPTIVINGAGEYDMLQEFTIPKKPVPPPPFKENSVARKQGVKKAFSADELNGLIFKHPEFPGGNDAFKTFLETLGSELSPVITPGKKRMFIPVEFVVDADGKVVNVVVDKMANNEMNNIIIQRFEGLAPWKPALGQKENPMPRKLTQTVIVDALEEVKVVVTEDD